MTRDVSIAIVGAGYMAREHARAFVAHSGIRIVGICGRRPDRTAALAADFDAPRFDNPSEMYAATRADVVVVAVNEISMRKVCEQVFGHPWICLLEKPVGLDLAEADAILAAARDAKARAYAAFNRRSYSSTRQAAARSADAGSRLISVLDQQDLASVRASGRPEAVISNYMFANSIHLIDYFTLFARGEVTEVKHLKHWNPRSPGHVVATIAFSSGDIGVYQAVWDAPGPWSVTITDKQLRAELRPLEKLAVQLRGERRLVEVEVDAVDIEFKPGLHRQASEILRALEGKPPALANLQELFRSMELCAKLYELGESPP